MDVRLSICALAMTLGLGLAPEPARAVLVSANPAASRQKEWARLSPFTDVRVEGDVVHVRFEEHAYTLVSMQGLSTSDILAHCRRVYGDKWEKRFAEDLVEVLAGMGRAVSGAVDLVLETEPGEKRIEKKGAALTAENRARLYAERKQRGQPKAGTPAPGKDGDRLSPFTDARLRADAAEVRFEERWYALVSIDGIDAEKVIDHCRKTYGERAEKRFAEDLVDVLAGLGRKPGRAVDLVLRDLETGERIERRGAPMTEANRRRVWQERQKREATGKGRDPASNAALPSAPVERTARAHAAVPAKPFEFLARVREPFAGEVRLARGLAEQDLDQLEWHLDHEYSYRDLPGIDWRAALDAVRAGLPQEVGRGALAEGLMKFIALFGDGHSGLEGDRVAGERSTPFLLDETGGAVVAFEPDRSGFLDRERPRVLALDGVPIDRWIEAAGAIVARGAPHLVRRRALRGLRDVDFVRRELGLPASDEIVLELADLAGAKTKRKTMSLAATRPVYGPWPRKPSGILAGNVGYLRIESMEDDPAFLAELERHMQSFRGTRGLVIDVRGNGGGSRMPLLTLFPYLMRAGDPPRIASVAAVRVAVGETDAAPEGLLADRFAFPASAARWSPAERATIERAEAAFRPKWTPPKGEFSAWHWLVLAHAERAGVYFYEQPVVVLLDGGCFSATDIFLAALQGWRNVTLLGLASSGGSGRARRVTLAHSGLSVRLSSMASFRADGTPYDGAGIAPDVRVEPGAGWFVGASDEQLDAALARLR